MTPTATIVRMTTRLRSSAAPACVFECGLSTTWLTDAYDGQTMDIMGAATMSEYKDWKITLPFTVPAGDTDGVMTDALFNAALEHAPSDAAGLVARGDANLGKV